MVWSEGFREYSKNPIFGLGLGQRIYVENEDYRDFVEVRNIHNSLLVLLFQFGLTPFFLFLAFIYANLKDILQKAKKDWIDTALIIFLVYYLVIFLFQPYLETNLLGIFFWIILGLIAARTRNANSTIIAKTQS
jgi:O-antigen ligase